jgi:hypothetical protein
VRRIPEQAGKAMTSDEPITQLDDPALLTEYSRVREQLQALAERYQALSDELSRRAAGLWTR